MITISERKLSVSVSVSAEISVSVSADISVSAIFQAFGIGRHFGGNPYQNFGSLMLLNEAIFAISVFLLVFQINF
jgi:hypothetical protein